METGRTSVRRFSPYLRDSMSLHACTVCGKQISTKAERCPHCGRKPVGDAPSDLPVPFLVSAAEVRRRKVNCRECRGEMTLGSSSCPNCGFTDTGGTRPGWRLLLAVAVLFAVGGSAAAAWYFGFLPGRAPRASDVGVATVDSATLEAELRKTTSRRRRRDPPRTPSARFPALCLNP